MNSSLSAHTLVLVVLALAGAAAFRSDTSAVEAKPRVVYLGNGRAETDPYFQRFLKAVQTHQPWLLAAAAIEFVDTPDEDEQRLAATVARAAATRPALLVAPNGAVAIAVRHTAPDTPLVFSSYADPLRFGIVSSMLRRPEPSAGIWVSDQLDGKRLEVLRDAFPQVRRVAVLGDHSWGINVEAEKRLPPVAARLQMELTILYAETFEEAQALLDDPRTLDYDAWCLPRTGLTLDLRLVEWLRAHHKPVILGSTNDVRAGAPMSYALDTSFVWPAMAELVSRVVAGEFPGAIPLERPQRFVLAMRTQPDNGFPSPSPEIVRRADLVIR